MQATTSELFSYLCFYLFFLNINLTHISIVAESSKKVEISRPGGHMQKGQPVLGTERQSVQGRTRQLW
jgi:hypothetical protein